MSSALEQPRRLRALLTDFDAVLSAEYEALRQRDADSLDAAVASKQRLAREIEVLTAHVTPPPATVDLALLDEWSAIRALLSRCALANRTNGAAIDASRCFITSMLDILSGSNIRERTYTARGRLAAAMPRAGYERI